MNNIPTKNNDSVGNKLAPRSAKTNLQQMYHAQMDSFFDSFFAPFLIETMIEDPFWTAMENVVSPTFRNRELNISETENAYVYSLTIPGINRSNLNVSIVGEQLLIEHSEQNNNEHERYYGSFSKSFTLPNNIDQENIKAEYKDEILRISIPKIPISKRTIEIMPVTSR